MKKLTLLLIISLSSCSVMMDGIITLGMTGYNEYYMEEWEKRESYIGISTYIRSNIEYTKDKFISHTQSPEETMKRGKGDCEDISILFMNIARVALDIKMQAVVVKHTRAIEEGGIDFNHVVVRYNGQTIEPQTGMEREYAVNYYYEYDEVFN